MQLGKLSLRDAWTYLLGDLGDSRAATVLRRGMLGGVLVAGAWLVYFAGATLSMPYPLEFREGAAQVMTKLLLHGLNPFSLANQPLGTNNYGIIYGLVVWPFAALFGNTLLVHRLISAIFVAMSGVMVLQTIWTRNKNAGLAMGCAILVAMGLAARAGLGAFPSAAGAFFYLAAIIIPFKRSFEKAGLALSAVLCLLAFYTKPYYVLALAIVASYVFICVSMKRALLYGLLAAIVFGASFLVVRYLFPFYVLDVAISNISHAKMLPSWASFQLYELALEFYPALVLGLVALLQTLPGLRLQTAEPESRSPRQNSSFLDRPLVSKPWCNYFAFSGICSTLAFIFVLGPSRGAYMIYEYQLMLPLFFLWLGLELKARNRLGLIVMPLLLLNLFTFADERLNPAFLDQRSSEAWARVYQILDQSHRVLNSPVLVTEMIRLGMDPPDSGQTEYYYNINGRDYPGNNLLGPGFDIIQSNGQAYLDRIQAAVAKREFDSIMITEKWGLPEDLDLIRSNYRLTETITVPMPQRTQNWPVEIWVPIDH